VTLFFLLLVLGIIAIVCGFFLPVQQPVRKALTVIGIVLMVAAVAVLILFYTIWAPRHPVVPVHEDCTVSGNC
jgi:hypothetical protein